MQKKIAILPGDGIGPEIITQSLLVLEAICEKYGYEFTYEYGDIGAIAIDQYNDPLPPKTLDLLKTVDAILFGAIGDPKYDNDPNAKIRPEQGLLKMRKELGLFANIRPVKAIDALIDKSPLKKEIVAGVDLVIFRELIGGIYFGEKQRTADFASDNCHYFTKDIERITHAAFEYARNRRKKITLVDKANVLETSRLWRATVTEIAKNQYPDIALDFLFVDNAAMQLILNPAQFDVMLTENMFGDILSDEASVITGSIGLLPSASVGASVALFEPIHGSYPQAKGKDIANPSAMILSAAMMLDYLGAHEAASAVVNATTAIISAGIGTEDLHLEQTVSCSEFGRLVANKIKE